LDLPKIYYPNTKDILIPPNTKFDLPIADVPYLDPALLPSLEQVQSGLAEDQAKTSEEEEEQDEEVQGINPEQIPLNLPKNLENTSTVETVGTFNIPFFNYDFPIPAPEVIASSVISAGVASTVAVGGSIAAQAVVGQLKKILKKIFTKVLKKEVKELQTKKD
tara:strand:- start:117 stop:605 length:489 start_codon:yes stop_codon:yes gene_type:complete